MSSNERLLTKEDITKLEWRSMAGAASCNYERLTAKSFCWIVGPCLKKIYGDDKKAFSEALQRHLVWYNTTPQFYSWFGGLMVAMEEENKKNPDFDTSSINAVKTALMGPMSGIGDALFISTFRVIGATIAIDMASAGNPIAPIIYFLCYNIPSMIFRFFGGDLGYSMGTGLLDRVEKSGLMSMVLEAASILGLMVVGAMVYINTWPSINITWGGTASPQNLMTILNSIVPGLYSLLVVLFYFWLNKKKVNTTLVVFGTLIVCIICAAIGLM